jgi:hypothetical protein
MHARDEARVAALRPALQRFRGYFGPVIEVMSGPIGRQVSDSGLDYSTRPTISKWTRRFRCQQLSIRSVHSGRSSP